MTTNTTLPPAAETDQVDAASDPSTNAIGERLRNIRRQQGLSLADVQQRSNGHWKAVVIGAYERGDRSVSIARLAELARFYGVPLVDLLPANRVEQTRAAADRERDQRAGSSPPVRLNLEPLRQPRTPEVAAVARFARRVQLRRGDHNGRMLTLRGGDLSTIAIAIGREDQALLDILHREGVLDIAA